MRRSFVAGLCLLASTTSASAATLTFSSTVGQSNAPASLQRFDPSLGTLTNVALTLGASGDLRFITMNPTNVTGATLSVSNIFTFTFNSDDGQIDQALFANPVVVPFRGSMSVPAGNGQLVIVNGTTVRLDGELDGLSSAFTGTSPFSLWFTLRGRALGSVSSSAIEVEDRTRVSANATVTYEYTPADVAPEPSVPEPTSLMLALAAAGAAWARRRA